MNNYKSDNEKLIQEVSRLTAALEDMNFECQRLVIINSNLDYQLKESKRELKQNISLLQTIEDENASLKQELRNMK